MNHKIKTVLIDDLGNNIDETIKQILKEMREDLFDDNWVPHHHSLSIYRVSSLSVSVTVSAVFV